jgi:hypothetical protein
MFWCMFIRWFTLFVYFSTLSLPNSGLWSRCSNPPFPTSSGSEDVYIVPEIFQCQHLQQPYLPSNKEARNQCSLFLGQTEASLCLKSSWKSLPHTIIYSIVLKKNPPLNKSLLAQPQRKWKLPWNSEGTILVTLIVRLMSIPLLIEWWEFLFPLEKYLSFSHNRSMLLADRR